jgi:hypothetical protein
VAHLPGGLKFFDQLLEGQMVVSVGGEAHLAQVAEEMAEGVKRRDVSSDDEGVEEEADEMFGEEMQASGEGRADEDIGLMRVEMKEEREGREEGHEEGRSLSLAQ